MSDTGTSVTLIFYKVGSEWWKEPALNLLAAAAQMSSYTHVEIALGEVLPAPQLESCLHSHFSICTTALRPLRSQAPGTGGQMANVARIYNDNVGVELCERTGRNPQYTYLSLGCSKVAEARMLAFARQQVGKPFSNTGMARSVLFPRQSTMKTFYCAELVAAILKSGGLMSADSNPGAATPYSLYKLYSKQAAATANPFTLRQTGGLSFHAMKSSKSYASVPTSNGDTLQLLQQSALPAAPSRALAVTGGSMRSRSDSPPRASFRLLVDPAPQQRQGHLGELTLSLTSLR